MDMTGSWVYTYYLLNQRHNVVTVAIDEDLLHLSKVGVTCMVLRHHEEAFEPKLPYFGEMFVVHLLRMEHFCEMPESWLSRTSGHFVIVWIDANPYRIRRVD